MRKQSIARTGFANNADNTWTPRRKQAKRSKHGASVGKRGKSPGYIGSPFRYERANHARHATASLRMALQSADLVQGLLGRGYYHHPSLQ